MTVPLNHSLSLIIARSGSQRIKGKNRRLLSGRPLYKWSVDAAIESKCFDEVWLSSDDNEILETAKDIEGLCVDKRPHDLATNSAKGTDVLRYILEKARRQSPSLKNFCLLLPTSPFRNAKVVQEVMTALAVGKLEFVVGIQAFHVSPMYRVSTKDGLHPADPSLLDPHRKADDRYAAYHLAGGIFAGRIDAFLERGHFYGQRSCGFEIDPISAWDIDTEQEWAAAEIIASGLSASHLP